MVWIVISDSPRRGPIIGPRFPFRKGETSCHFWRVGRRSVRALAWFASLAQDEVGSVRGGRVFGQVVAEFGKVEVCEEGLAGADEGRGDSEVEIVNEAGAEKLLDGGDAPADANVFAIGGGDGALEGGVDAVGDEMEGGSPSHGDGRSGVMS